MFYDIYLRLCNLRNIAPTTAAVEMGFKKSVVTRWKNGVTPRDANLRKISDYFNVSVNYLLGKEETSPTVSAEDDETIIIRQSLKDRPYRKVVFYVDPRVSEEDIADAIEKVEALALVKELKESGKLPDALK